MKLSSLSALALVAVPAISSANLLNNPGFETYTGPSFSNYNVLNGGNTSVTGWTVGYKSVDIVDAAYAPYQGAYAIDLAGTPGPGSVSQVLNVADGVYKVSFYGKSNQSGALATVAAQFGLTQQTFELDGTWKKYSFLAEADGYSTFSLATLLSNKTNGNVLVDTASIEAVPEPASMAALGVGAIGLLRRRRAAKK